MLCNQTESFYIHLLFIFLREQVVGKAVPPSSSSVQFSNWSKQTARVTNTDPAGPLWGEGVVMEAVLWGTKQDFAMQVMGQFLPYFKISPWKSYRHLSSRVTFEKLRCSFCSSSFLTHFCSSSEAAWRPQSLFFKAIESSLTGLVLCRNK